MSKNFDIGHTLRHLRMDSGIKIKDAVKKLKEARVENVGEKTLYNYEIGYSNPNADVFLELCVIYGCSNPLKWYDKDSLTLSEEERKFVKEYRLLDIDTKNDIAADVTRKYDRIMDKKKGKADFISSRAG